MRLSSLFSKTRKEAPKDEISKNASLLVRAGFIDKLSAGVYSYLPLGLLALKNIEKIIKEEMESLGAAEVLLPALHPKENWQTTGRWDSLDVLFKFSDAFGHEFALGPTHEEVITPLAKNSISSYRDLPKAVYQFQNKFRMEKRAKSGLLRGREFLMKDLYSFHDSEEDLKVYYEKVSESYKRIFTRVGIGQKTHLTYASGGSFAPYSHEFQTLTEAGEDTIFLCANCQSAVNKEIFKEGMECPHCQAQTFSEERAIEVGNIFLLKNKFSLAFNVTFKDENGELHPVQMGCYGIGVSRLLGAVVEVLADEKGLVWPEEVAPATLHIVDLTRDSKNKEIALALYHKAKLVNGTVLFDDREIGAGEKLADADLLGMPVRVVISDRTLEKEAVEITTRRDGETKEISLSQFENEYLRI